MSETPHPVFSVGSESQDDILALADAFSLPGWSYVDIARQERLSTIIARWPLLEELVSQAGIKEQ
ncbi:hypothetical protein NG99_05380 [Erwinia typographi]|uniref:Cellulose biosynthesis protein BcsR n=1 Tax=Erwinia typographi TaxID=371042 RepID=A0A0A3ZBS5_9GAMM|nr:cellulose biosynthesis protein BcsR [Erwinia typographi]KGT95071.1 hypothetical protein NG99_05380 [Erwinia typographi]